MKNTKIPTTTLLWASYWKHQTFPKPTAYPIIANRAVRLLPHDTLLSSPRSNLNSGLDSPEPNLLLPQNLPSVKKKMKLCKELTLG